MAGTTAFSFPRPQYKFAGSWFPGPDSDRDHDDYALSSQVGNLNANYARIMQITHKLCTNYAHYTDAKHKLCINYANYAQTMHKLCTLCTTCAQIMHFMHKLCINYARYAKLCKNYAKIMQKLCKSYQKKLRKTNYAKIALVCVNCITSANQGVII